MAVISLEGESKRYSLPKFHVFNYDCIPENFNPNEGKIKKTLLSSFFVGRATHGILKDGDELHIFSPIFRTSTNIFLDPYPELLFLEGTRSLVLDRMYQVSLRYAKAQVLKGDVLIVVGTGHSKNENKLIYPPFEFSPKIIEIERMTDKELLENSLNRL